MRLGPSANLIRALATAWAHLSARPNPLRFEHSNSSSPGLARGPTSGFSWMAGPSPAKALGGIDSIWPDDALDVPAWPKIVTACAPPPVQRHRQPSLCVALPLLYRNPDAAPRPQRRPADRLDRMAGDEVKTEALRQDRDRDVELHDRQRRGDAGARPHRKRQVGIARPRRDPVGGEAVRIEPIR